jgi:exonuclease SbcD
LRNRDLADLIGGATRHAFVRMIDLCLDERVDALLLAGDLYDGDQTSMKTARFLADQLRRLHEAGIRTFIVRGNHDALSKITRELIFPDSVKIFGGRAEAVAIERARGDLPVLVHGLSFAQPHAPESLLGRYKPPVEGAANIGILHTSLTGAPGHDPYAPCSLADLQATGFEYWALGHIHKRSVIEGRCTVVMPGMPQGRDVNESGAKSVSLITIGDDRAIRIEERFTSVAEFARIPVDVSDFGDWNDLAHSLGQALAQARDAASSEHLVGRLQLTGSTSLAWRIRADRDLLKTEMDSRAGRKCWVEKIEVDCRPPTALAGTSNDPRGELRRLVEEEVASSDSFRAEALAIAQELRDQLPAECRGVLGADEASFEAALTALVDQGTDDVLARLQAAGAEEA